MPFTAKLLWHCETCPEWEIETAHAEFPTAIAAAVFANGFTACSPAQLVLRGGRAVVRSEDDLDSDVLHGDEPHFRARRLRDFGADEAVVAWDDDYEDVEPDELLADSFERDLVWGVVAYDVIGPDGHVQVDIDLDDKGRLVVTVQGEESNEDDEPLLAVIPRA